jgi:hypothetical protein
VAAVQAAVGEARAAVQAAVGEARAAVGAARAVAVPADSQNCDNPHY